MRRAVGRGRRGPGLVGTAARTAVVAGTATAVAGRVATSQAARQGTAHPAQDVRPLPTAPAPVTATSVDQLHEALTKLGALRDAGLLTDEELAVQKARLLGP